MTPARIHQLASRLADQCLPKDDFGDGWYGFNADQLEHFAKVLLSEGKEPPDTEGDEV